MGLAFRSVSIVAAPAVPRAASRSCARAAPPPPPTARSLAARSRVCGLELLPQARSAAAPRRLRAAPQTSALFKQDKESIQWTTVVTTFLACSAFIVPLVRRGKRAA